MPTALTKSFAFLLSLFAVITVTAQNPLAPALGFQIFSESNIQMKGGTIEGALAAGGNFEVAGNAQYNGGNSSGIGRSYVTIGANTYALIANGNYVATSGNFFVNSSNRWIKFGNLNGAVSGTNNFNQLRVTRNNVYVHVNNTRQVFSQVAGTGLVDFTTAFNSLRATASGLAACTNTGVSVTNIGTIARINLSNGKNVWNLTGTQLNNISILSFSASPSASRPLIINVNAAGSYTLKMPTFSGIGISQAPYIIFNFYNATSINYTGSNAYGAILATNAAFTKTGSQTIAGQVIVKSYSQSAGNLQYAPFNTNAAVCVTCITSTSAGANQTQCNNAQFNLQATAAPTGSTGKWSVLSGSAVIANTNSNSTTATITGSTATLRWTVSKTGCANVVADIVLTNNQVSANAGVNLRNCNNANFILQATNPGAGFTGLWTVTTGAASISNATAYNSAVVLQSDSAQLKWTVTKSGCSASAFVQLKNNKLTANAGTDQDSRCNGNVLTLQASAIQGTTGTWTLISGNAIVADPQNAGSTVEVIQSPAVLRWTISDGNCSANDNVQVSVKQPYKIVVLGSSTAAGVGASVSDSAWVSKLSNYFVGLNSNSQVINLGVPGYDSYQVLCPTGFTPPSNRPSPDDAHNISAALQYQPDAIIINLPTNDVANGYSLEEQKQNFERTIALTNRAHIRVWVTTAQPRNAFDAAQVAQLLAQRDWVNQRFGDFAIDFWSTIADANNQIDPAYNADDIHVNDAGHQIFYSRALAANIPDAVCQPWQNKVPEAFAGNNQFIGNPSQVTLNGSGSYDADGSIASYNWRQVSGTALVITNANAALATVNVPQGIYSFELTVTDDEGAVAKDTVTLTITTRILVDAGSIELTPAPDANGKFWNNLSDGKTGFELSNLVTTTNVATGITLTVINRIDGTYAVNANGLYGYNTVGQVGDYPASATSDYAFAHTSTTTGKWGFSGLEVDKKYDFKFWGTKDADSRWIEIKLEGDSVWHAYDAGRNSNYEQAAYISVSGVTAANFEIRVKAGSSFGYISVVDIAVQPLVEQPLSNLPPIANAGQDQILNTTVSNTAVTGNASTDIDGNVVAYSWRQVGGATVQLTNSNNAIANIDGLQEGVFTFELTVTDDEAASSVDTVRITVGKRILLDFGNIDLTNSPDANGRYWNNIQSGITGTSVANLVNAENEPTAIGFEIPARIDGTFAVDATGLYGYNTIGAVGEYPASTTSDYAFAHTSTTAGQWKLTNLDAAKQYTVKFWGTKDASSRWIEIRLLGTENWQTYDAGFNADYNRAASFTFTGLTEATFEIRVKAGSSFGYINVVDISVTLPESMPISSRANNNSTQKVSNAKPSAISKNDFTVFPNPSNGNFKIKLGQELNHAEMLEIKLETIAGQMVYSARTNSNNGLITVNPTVQPKPGLYVVRIVGKQKAWVQTIVIR